MRVDQDKILSMIEKARHKGVARQNSLLSWEAHYEGNCLEPKIRYFWSYVAFSLKGTAPSKEFTLFARCRQCKACLKVRQDKWRVAARWEIAKANRTWLCTFTGSPDWFYVAEIIIASELRKKNIDFSEYSEEKKFKALANELGKEATLFLKRLRKVTKSQKGQLRYLLVTEFHKSGLPHLHALIYECGEGKILKRQIQSCWSAGFSGAKLADKNSPGYVSKYLSKSMVARVRASIGFGE